MSDTISVIRKKSRERLDLLSWPTAVDESWRRTSLAGLPLDDLSMLDPALTNTGLSVDNDTPDTVQIIPFISPEYPDEHSGFGDNELFSRNREISALLGEAAAESRDKVSLWHFAALNRGVMIDVRKGAVSDSPVIITLDEDAVEERVSSPHIHIQSEAWSSADIIILLKGSSTEVVNLGLTGTLGSRSKTSLTVINLYGKSVNGFLEYNITMGAEAELQFNEVHLGCSLMKSRSRIQLLGTGSDLRMNGLYLAGKNQHYDISTVQSHISPNAESRALYKGIIAPGGRSIYQGLIEVDEKAAKTDAYLTNKNILLGKGARADSIPKLNIHTNDVRCSHGSTTGKLDPDQVFYLMSRGFSREQAGELLLQGFLAEITDLFPQGVMDIIDVHSTRRLRELING